MDFRQEVFQFIQAHSNEIVKLMGSKILIPSANVSFTPRCIATNYESSLQSERIIWEDQWAKKRPIVESRILSTLGKSKRIHGRKTIIKKLTQPEVNNFLNNNHLIGTTKAKTKLCLTYNDEIVAAVTFSGPTKLNRGGIVYRSYELIRYCTLNGFSVVGGLSKLINHFIKLEEPDDIMTYVDREWSEGKSYGQLGFEMVGQTPPKEFWIDPDQMVRYNANQINTDTSHLRRIQNTGNLKFIRFLK